MEENPVKRGVVLFREPSTGQWAQRLITFDEIEGVMHLVDPVKSLKMTFIVPDRRGLKVRPSPYLIPQYPQAVALHLYPLVQEGGDEQDVHISALDRRDIQEWSYYFQNWAQKASNDQSAPSTPSTSLVPNLTDKEEQIAETLLDLHAEDQQTVLIDKFNIPIRRRTLHCLRDSQWLSDEVLNFYFALLHEKAGEARKIFCWNSFFFSKLSSSGYTGVRNWTTRKNIDLFNDDQVELILMPVHLGDHWALGVVNMRLRTTMYLDSLGGDSPDFHAHIQGYLEEEYKSKRPGKPSLIWGREKPLKNLPLQSNGSDCGVFVCMYALALASGGDLLGATSDRVPVMRRRIACDIVRGRIKRWPQVSSSEEE
jgi:Ulp1 family protease